MAVETRWVRYGREAAEALRAEIVAAKQDEPLAPVTVVVPSNHVGVAARRLLASGALGSTTTNAATKGLVAVTFLTTYRLAELLGAPALAGQGRKPVSTPVITAAVRAALAQDPGMFRAVASHPATETALVASYRELRDLTPTALEAVRRTGRRASDVVRLHRATRTVLEGAWYDEEDLMRAATDAVRSRPLPADLGTVVVFLPQRVSGHAAALLRAAAERTDVVVLAGRTGRYEADEEVRASLVRLGSDQVDPGRSSPDVGAGGPVAAERTHLVVTSDADEEVREAVRAVVDAARAGTPLDRIAVLYATASPYDRLLREHLAGAGIAANGSASVPVAERMAGRTLLGFLALPELSFRRQDVLDWLTAAPLLLEGRRAPVAAWERISREAGVVAGRGHWDRLLAGFARRELERASAGEDEERPPWWLDQRREQSDRAEQLRSFVLGLMDELAEAAAKPDSWSGRARWAKRALERFLGGPERRVEWPADERKAAEAVEQAIDRLSVLDELEPTVSLEVFARTLTVELESDRRRIGRLGEGVLVGSISMGLGLDLDLVVTCGMAEGSFPGTVHDDSLLPDRERDAAGGELALRRQQIHRQHRELLATLAGARRQVLTVPRGDLRRSSERVPSRWVLEVASELAGERMWGEHLFAAEAPWITHVASFDGGLRSLSFPATEQEHRLRAVLAADPRRRGVVAVAAELDPRMHAGVSVLDARASDRFTRFDGNLAGLAIPSPVEHGSSATSLERWAGCPFRYAMENLLRIQPVENPEEQLEITALDRGSLVHEVLERFVIEVIAAPELPPTARWDEERLVAIAEEVCDRYEAEGLTGRPIFWRRERARIISGLRTFLDHDLSYRAARGSHPVATELPFGRDGRDPVHYPLPDGRTVPMRGNADRVDLGADGTIHVADYKTGKAYDELPEDDPSVGGTRLQLAIYGQAARQAEGRPEAPVHADYWFVTAKGRFRTIGRAITPEVVEAVGASIGRIVEGIEAGVFLPRPAPPGWRFSIPCEFCEPDRLGTTELWRQWTRKITDPALEGYRELAGLVEPEGAA
jgi:RecB family exonuclease